MRKAFFLGIILMFCLGVNSVLGATFETNDTVSQGFITGDLGVWISQPTTCFTGSPVYIDSDSDNAWKRGYYTFDFSGLIYDSINNATLELSLNQRLNYNVGLSYEMYYCNDTFTECEVTWNNQTEKVTNCSATPFYTTTTWNLFGDNTTFNMTEIILNESVDDKIFSIKMKMNPENFDSSLRRVSWYTKEYATSSGWPRLIINYELGTDTTPPKYYNISEPLDNQPEYEDNLYNFNVTFLDETGVDTVTVTFNNTEYETNKTGDIYYNIFSNLTEGIYNYSWVGNDTSNNTNTTDTYNFSITASTSTTTTTTIPQLQNPFDWATDWNVNFWVYGCMALALIVLFWKI